MSHAKTADKLLIKPAAGARPAPPRTRGQIIPKARTSQSPDESHAARRQPGWRASQTDTLAESYRCLRRQALGRRPVGNDYGDVERRYQSAWTAVPLCNVATVPLALHAIAVAISDQLFAASCQCRAIPAGDA